MRNLARHGYGLIAVIFLIAVLSWPVQARQDTSASMPGVIDIRGIWKDTKLDAKGAAARGLNASEIQTPRKVKNVPPEYPTEARQLGIQGTVYVECVIDVGGVPTGCKVTHGSNHPSLREAALRCVKGWRFKPLTVRARPAPALAELTVSFVANFPPP